MTGVTQAEEEESRCPTVNVLSVAVTKGKGLDVTICCLPDVSISSTVTVIIFFTIFLHLHNDQLNIVIKFIVAPARWLLAMSLT